ncbi:MAG: hypothetical protein ACOH13_14150 [Flavobacteriales bacterium]
MNNYERLIQLAEDSFAAHDDPQQLVVTPEVLARLRCLHPATVSERTEADGPVAWVLLLPTTLALMEQWLAGTITEKELYEQTPDQGPYEAVYLNSALVLEEYRGRGISKELTIAALEDIRQDHPVKALFNWPFSPQGAAVAQAVAKHVGLPMHVRKG